jgi:DNA-binding NarL/FixJ family response regulator
MKPLSDQESIVILLLLRGMTHKEIASTLGISITTVAHHLQSAKRKSGCRSAIQLILYKLQRATRDCRKL